jgi:hypothetical protein
MSYTLTLQCGCTVYVATHPTTAVPHSRILEQRAPGCTVRKHEVGLHLALWELLPESEESHTRITKRKITTETQRHGEEFN